MTRPALSRVFSPASMAARFRPYGSVFRIMFVKNLQYRTAALAGMATQLAWGLMLIMVLEAFYKSGDAAPPMTLPELASYNWLRQAFLTFVMLWYRDTELLGQITSGQAAYELCRPASLYYFWYARLLAQRAAGAALRCLPILLVAFFLPAGWRLSLPASLPGFLMFMLTLMSGLLLNVAISMFIYILTFLTLSPLGPMLLIATIGEFCSGMIVPVPLMPDWLQNVLYTLPFHLTADLPFRIWSGHMPMAAASRGFLLQAAWLAVLVAAGFLAMRGITRRIVIQGG